MAVPNWSDSDLAGQLGLTETLLLNIIDASNAAGEEMMKLRARVDEASNRIRMAMQSDAGAILSGRLQLWHNDFLPIISMFVGDDNSLTARTTEMYKALVRANADATRNAGANQA
jgi:hypothetical protein